VSDEPSHQAAPAPTGLASPEEKDALLSALWDRALEAWDDDKPHQALLEYALREQKLPELAGRYRVVKDTNPERAARAQKKLDGIVIAATQMLVAMKTPAERAKVPLSMTLTAFAVTAVLIGWLTYALFHR
jgi:FMN-dependent NADH-azoreductase